jgi:7-cyano-7-deazaguanine synthase in queuosine biosynthesis
MKKETLLYGRTRRAALPERLRGRFDVVNVDIGDTRRPGTFRSDVGRLREICGPAWNSELFDLLTVACTLRAADRFFPSGEIFDNARRIAVAATVFNIFRWERLRGAVRRAAALLSSDDVRLHPYLIEPPPPDARCLGDTPRNAAIRAYRPDCVCLFSGGADSFCGVAHLLREGRRPLLVCQSVGPISRRQQELFAALQRRFPKLADTALIQLRAFPNSAPKHSKLARIWRSRDDLQRLRSMFFFSLAAIVGRAFGLDELFMCENGVIGAAVVFAPDQDSPYTTRPAEPRYLRQMQTVLRGALRAPSLRIRNPFQYSTKGEVLRECADLGLAEPLYRTVSCWRIGNRGVRNCGVCVPCMYRQLAFDEAALPVRERDYRRAAIPARRWERWRSPETHRLYALRDYCRELEQEGIGSLFAGELAVIEAVDVTGGPAAQPPASDEHQAELDERASGAVAAMLIRFARAMTARLQ